MNELTALRNLCVQARRLRMTAPIDDDFSEIMNDFRGAHDQAHQLLNTGKECFDMVALLNSLKDFSINTFGPGTRTEGVLDHIRKELNEIEAKPNDLMEWTDLLLLGFGGALRQGYDAETILGALVEKQTIKENRQWPDWRTAEPGKAIEHVRTGHELTKQAELSKHIQCPKHDTGGGPCYCRKNRRV